MKGAAWAGTPACRKACASALTAAFQTRAIILHRHSLPTLFSLTWRYGRALCLAFVAMILGFLLVSTLHILHDPVGAAIVRLDTELGHIARMTARNYLVVGVSWGGTALVMPREPPRVGFV